MRVAGFGFRGSADVAALRAALEAAGGAAGVGAVATAADKAGAAAFAALAGELDLPVMAVPLADIAAAPVALSARAPQRYGGRGLAEAAALAAAGPGARLVALRALSPCGRATCAIAERTLP
ncbi:MAG: cobalamin biosynthesis protein [Gemmobacter sp.]